MMYTLVGDMFFADMNDEEFQNVIAQFKGRNVIFAFNTRIGPDRLKVLSKNMKYILLKGKHDTEVKDTIKSPKYVVLDGRKVLLMPYSKNIQEQLLCYDHGTLDAAIIGGRVDREILRYFVKKTRTKFVFFRPKEHLEIETVQVNGAPSIIIGAKSRASLVVNVDFSNLPSFEIERIHVPQGRVLL